MAVILNATARILQAKAYSDQAVSLLSAHPGEALKWLTRLDKASTRWFGSSWSTKSEDWQLLMQLRHLFPLGNKTYTVYRGTNLKKKLRKGQKLVIDTRLNKRPIESWTLSRRVAQDFGAQYVLKAEVKSEYVVFNHEILVAMLKTADLLTKQGHKEVAVELRKITDNLGDYYEEDFGAPKGQNEIIVAVGAFPKGMTVEVISDPSSD